jgi:predicted O-methyltransferase YrrM
LAYYLACSERIPGWKRGDEAFELARVCCALPAHAVVVEIGSFLGSSAVLLAGALKTRGSGKLHCIDPFDASGDAHSAPHYRQMASQLDGTLRQTFDRNVHDAGLDAWVEVHQGAAETIGEDWTTPIDMLFLDGDQSPEGARLAYDLWASLLKRGGIIAIGNSSDRTYNAGHDGSRRVVVESVRPPLYSDVYCVVSTTFARKRT